MADQDEARAASPAPPTAAMSGFADRPADRAGLLRAAAAAGRTAEVKALLVQGVSVDAADANGKTALMEGIQADRPAVVALLRRHGASLDAEDNAGESARDMAAAKGDPALNQSLGLAP
jgi:ankyrin repeat protein